MKSKIFLLAMAFNSVFATAQQIPKTVLAEHFTNTYCSICASRNPGLFTNLSSFPDVIHLAIYPSAPYAACPLSMHNPSEADARTNYYSVYGATPRLVVGGSLVTGYFTDPAIFSSQLSLTTSFALYTSIEKVGVDSIAVKVVVKKVDTSSLTALQIFGCIAEDTLSFTAANGETASYDVFRKALWGTTSLGITAPLSVGDSSIYSKTIAINAVWNLSRLYAVSVLQQADRKVVQASRSARLQVPAQVADLHNGPALTIYPNPATDRLFIDKPAALSDAYIIDIRGGAVKHINDLSASFIDISTLNAGIYFLTLNSAGQTRSARFIKK